MPGETVVIAADGATDGAGRMRSFVGALARFPAEPPWVVVGGFAVNVRLAQVHRLTNDLDTISSRQAELVEVLLAGPGTDRLDPREGPSDDGAAGGRHRRDGRHQRVPAAG